MHNDYSIKKIYKQVTYLENKDVVEVLHVRPNEAAMRDMQPIDRTPRNTYTYKTLFKHLGVQIPCNVSFSMQSLANTKHDAYLASSKHVRIYPSIWVICETLDIKASFL